MGRPSGCRSRKQQPSPRFDVDQTTSSTGASIHRFMQEDNPYNSPLETSFVEPQVDSRSYEIASQGRRFLNLVIDGIAFRLIGFVIVTGMVIAKWDRFFTIPLSGILLDIFIFAVYYFTQEILLGRTLAKYITGTKVVTADGSKPVLFQIVARTLLRLVPFEPFSCLGKRPVGWHDEYSGTRVVLVRSSSSSAL